jgi:hypothetical protein
MDAWSRRTDKIADRRSSTPSSMVHGRPTLPECGRRRPPNPCTVLCRPVRINGDGARLSSGGRVRRSAQPWWASARRRSAHSAARHVRQREDQDSPFVPEDAEASQLSVETSCSGPDTVTADEAILTALYGLARDSASSSARRMAPGAVGFSKRRTFAWRAGM